MEKRINDGKDRDLLDAGRRIGWNGAALELNKKITELQEELK